MAEVHANAPAFSSVAAQEAEFDVPALAIMGAWALGDGVCVDDCLPNPNAAASFWGTEQAVASPVFNVPRVRCKAVTAANTAVSSPLSVAVYNLAASFSARVNNIVSDIAQAMTPDAAASAAERDQGEFVCIPGEQGVWAGTPRSEAVACKKTE